MKKSSFIIIGIVALIATSGIVIYFGFILQNPSNDKFEITKIETTIPAPSLECSLFENPNEQPYIIFLPSSYNTTTKQYPVVYFLHGFSTSVNDFNNLFSTYYSLKYRNIEEMIFVLVNGHHEIIGGTFYENSPLTGNWEDFVVLDVVNYTDTHFRTIPEARFRGIAGLSMGGYGALNIAMKHPDIFGISYAISPGLFNESGLSDCAICDNHVVDYVINIENELKGFQNKTEAHNSYVNKLKSLSSGSSYRLALAYGSAFSYNLNKNAPYMDYIYYNDTITETIVLNETAWPSWESGFGNISEEILFFSDNLHNLTGICIEYSSIDYYNWIPQGCEYYSQQLETIEINHKMIETNYGHAESLEERVHKHMVPYFVDLFDI